MREGGGMMFGLKRGIEEKTADYHARLQAERAERDKRASDRIAEVRAAADKAAPERLKKFREADRKAHSQWRFACKVSAGFIVMRWSEGGKDHTHGLNLSAVTDISLSSGRPVLAKGTGLVFNEYSWDYGSSWDRSYWSNYWTGEVRDCLWPSDSKFASITLAGPGFVIERIPHRKADEAYQAIMTAIEASALHSTEGERK